MTGSRRRPVHEYPRGILDTNTVILLDRLNDAAALPEHPEITTITLAELSVGPLVTDDPQARAARQAHLQLAESSFRALPFDAAAARRFGWVAASLREAGRKPAARAYDALIAAVALSNELPLYTVNPAGFQGIDGLTVRAVPHPDAAPRTDRALGDPAAGPGRAPTDLGVPAQVTSPIRPAASIISAASTRSR